MSLTEVVNVDPLPANPDLSDGENFRTTAIAYFGGFGLFRSQMNALGAATYANAEYAETLAGGIGEVVDTCTAAANTATEQADLALGYKTTAQAAALSAINAPGTNATSTTSNTINTSGPKSFTIQTGKAFSVGQYLMAANTASPTNYVVGQIASYNSGSGALSLTIVYAQGSGTYTAWTLSLVAYHSIQIEEFTPNALGTNNGSISSTEVGNYFTSSITSNTTFTFSMTLSQSGCSFAIKLAYTSGTITWPASVKWPYNVAPYLSAGKTYIFTFATDNGGTTWRGSVLPEYAS